MYWKVDHTSSYRKALVGTPSKDEASIFYIEKHSRPGEFNIAHCGEVVKSDSTSPVRVTHYLSASSKKSRHEGPVHMEGKAANLTLRHPAMKKKELSLQSWEEDACYIKLAPRRMQWKSYLALEFDGDTCESKCVESPKEEGKDRSMRFSLTRVGIDIGTVMRSRLCSDSAEISMAPDSSDQQIEQDASELMYSLNITCAEPTEGTESPTEVDDTFLAGILDIQTSSKLDEDEDTFPHSSGNIEEEEDLTDTDEDLDYDNSDCEELK